MSLKEVYNLSYDTSEFKSGLINWYNELIDKTYESLNIEDVNKMIRQDILKKVAMEKAIDLFLDNPFDGEYEDGDLLNLLLTLDFKNIDQLKVKNLKQLLKELDSVDTDFDWEQETLKSKYKKNVNKLLQKLEP